MRESAEMDAGERFGVEEEAVEGVIERVRGRLSGVDVRLRTVVRDHPMLALFGAVVVGYAVGRVLTRR